MRSATPFFHSSKALGTGNVDPTQSLARCGKSPDMRCHLREVPMIRQHPSPTRGPAHRETRSSLGPSQATLGQIAAAVRMAAPQQQTAAGAAFVSWQPRAASPPPPWSPSPGPRTQQGEFFVQSLGSTVQTLAPTAQTVAAASHQEKKTAAADTRFPGTGRPIAMNLLYLHLETSRPLLINQIEGHQVTSDWQLKHLLLASEMVTGVHRDSQKLFHAGKEILPGATVREAVGLEESRLPDWFTVHMLVHEERFPRRLEPYGLMDVPLKAEDFMLPRFSTRSGFHWMVTNEAVERHGVRSTGDIRVTAQCSPPCPITLTEEERKFLGIHLEATEFAWSYPVSNWHKVDRDPHLLDDWEMCGTQSSALKDFLAVGGFMFFTKDKRLLQVSTLLHNKEGKGGLQFSRPQRWDPLWTKAMLEDGRFQRVTIAPQRAAGAHFFCWLLPGETIMDEMGQPLHSQPEVPHGGFAYLFHELDSDSSQDMSVDCYFAISNASYVAPSHCESFELLGDEHQSELVGHTSAQLHAHSICLIEDQA
mmetsp:Transcript_49297/g.114259  ORF Transcript_49297/g.114259 Transcript_49297/m.114259 type:complete len:534 (+) Transcript_49297:36-1637(+)